jgi:hypothetical protein
MKVAALILVVLSSFVAVKAPADSSSASSSRLPANERANALLISTPFVMPVYWLLYQLEWWQINLEYHRKLNNHWELQYLILLGRLKVPDETPEHIVWYREVGLAGVRYLGARRQGFYFGGLLRLQFPKNIIKEWYLFEESFEPGLCLLAGYKHVFLSGLCINFAIATGITAYNELTKVRYEGWGTIGAGWAF